MPAGSEVPPVKRKTVALFSFIAFTLFCFTTIVQSLPVGAQEAETVIPPTVSSVRPTGLQRGTTKTFTVEGRNLAALPEAQLWNIA